MVGQTLREAREEAGYTQQDMANQLGISRATYIRIEQRPEAATVMQAKRICELLSKNYERIFFGSSASKTNATPGEDGD